jgi:hypothetical protein
MGKINKTFWEELIAYFLLCDTDLIENDAFNNSFTVACALAEVTFFPSLCLAMIGGYIYRQTEVYEICR